MMHIEEKRKTHEILPLSYDGMYNIGDTLKFSFGHFVQRANITHIYPTIHKSLDTCFDTDVDMGVEAGISFSKILPCAKSKEHARELLAKYYSHLTLPVIIVMFDS
jgi:hypothetical protein